tara:strand:+ start:320 stop:649 length:330 start_codon:yes stop_codon:yes gene_type:complete
MEDHIKKFFNALSIFESMCPKNMPTHHIQGYLFIASKPSATYREIEQALGVTNASASRICNALSDIKPKHRDTNLGLIEKYPDPKEGRRYRVRVTPSGKAIYKSLDILK